MTLMDYSYLLILVVVGVASILVIIVIDFLGKRKRHAQKLGESEEGKE